MDDAVEGPGDGPAVWCRGLVVRYGAVTAVDGVDLSAHAGQVLALLGPNGAGKTTTVETLTGYRRPAAGRAAVLGLDPWRHHRTLVRRVGVMPQRPGLYPMLSPARALRLFAAYYEHPRPAAELLALAGLEGVARRPWRHLSGGEQQRLSLALALVGRPEVVFLDEPTAGVDPEGRLALRQVVRDLRDAGTCVVLTTHELAEAEALADTVAIVHRGKVAAAGRPADLAAAPAGGPTGAAPGRVRFTSRPGLDTGALGAALGAVVTEDRPGHYRVDGPWSAARTAALATWLEGAGAPLGELRTGPSLEDTYLEVVGAAATAEPGPAPATGRRRRRGAA